MHSILPQMCCLFWLIVTSPALIFGAPFPLAPSTASATAPVTRTGPLRHAVAKRNAPDFFPAILNSRLPAESLNIDRPPEIPRIPNIFLPVVVRPNLPRQPHLLVTTSSAAQPTHPPTLMPPTDRVPYGQPSNDDVSRDNPYYQALLESCLRDRAPSLPLTSAPEIGVLRLFAKISYQSEIAIMKGCGCISLPSPLTVESFVGSRNHSFALYTQDRCEGEPYFQRFNQYFAVEPALLTNSVRIVQGVLAPIPAVAAAAAE